MEWLILLLLIGFFGFIFNRPSNRRTDQKKTKEDDAEWLEELFKNPHPNLKTKTRPASSEQTNRQSTTINKQELHQSIKPKVSSKITQRTKPKHSKKNEGDVLKQRGDGYELHIGRKFELKGDLVIYNGLIRGYEDQGIDLVIISKRHQTVHLVQCKHWKRYLFTAEHLTKIYDKLNAYLPDYEDLSPEKIAHYLSVEHPLQDIQTFIKNTPGYTVRKTLYLSSSQVIQPEVFAVVEPIKDNIYRYQDMKLVVHKL